MKYRRRTFYTDRQKSELWDRWQRGESLSSIGRRFDRASTSIFPHLARTGGTLAEMIARYIEEVLMPISDDAVFQIAADVEVE